MVDSDRRTESRRDLVDRTAGQLRGRSVAHVAVSPDGWTILVGRSAPDNDLLTFKLARPYDFWLHVSGPAGSHVVVLNDERADRLPKATQELAAGLAAGHSKASRGGRVAVSLCRCEDVSKPRDAPAGSVSIRRAKTVFAAPRRTEDLNPATEVSS